MFQKLIKRIQLRWMKLQINVRRDVLIHKKPAEFLQYCTALILRNPEFELRPTTRNVWIYSPQNAKEFTEILSKITSAIAFDKPVKDVVNLGPFKEMHPLSFLTTDIGCIDDGKQHCLFHVSAIREIANYLNRGIEEDKNYSRYNHRILSPLVQDLQLYIDQIFKLYRDA